MKRMEKQLRQPHLPSHARHGRGVAIDSPPNGRVAQLVALLRAAPLADGQVRVPATGDANPAMAAQRRMIAMVDRASRPAVQHGAGPTGPNGGGLPNGLGSRGESPSGISPLQSRIVQRSKAADARSRIATRYGITVSDDVSYVLLEKIENVLERLPTAHTLGNDNMRNIRMGGGGNESSFDGNHTIEVRKPRIPVPGNPPMPDFVYAALNKDSEFQRKFMDKGAMPAFDKTIDKAYGLESDERHVMSGVSDVNSRENLLTWTMRHEIGHSVDKRIGWEDKLSHWRSSARGRSATRRKRSITFF